MLNSQLRPTLLKTSDAKPVFDASGGVKQHWARIRRSEQRYAKLLRSIASQAGQFITQLYAAGREDAIEETLKN